MKQQNEANKDLPLERERVISFSLPNYLRRIFSHKDAKSKNCHPEQQHPSMSF